MSAVYTSIVAVNDVGDMEPIVTNIDCREVEVGEDPSVANWPTTDWNYKGAVASSAAVRKPAGTTHTFRGLFFKGTTVGYISTVSGSTSFKQTEMV